MEKAPHKSNGFTLWKRFYLSKNFCSVFLVFNIQWCCRLCGKCMTCQNQGSLTLRTKTEQRSITVPTVVMNQICIDICNLPEVDGFCCLVLCMDYFSKWFEAKALKDKKATTVSQFLYELIYRTTASPCRLAIKVESLSIVFSPNCIVLLASSNVWPYHPKANGLLERQNTTIKNPITKLLGSNFTDWPYVIECVLFSHRFINPF